MRRRWLATLAALALGAAVMAAAVPAPAEVLDNLDFFSDFELLCDLEILEGEGLEGSTSISTAAALFQAPVSTFAAQFRSSAEAVGASTHTGRVYETR